MSRSDDQRVADIVEAGEHLAVLVGDGRTMFEDDWMRQRATERLLEVIGEASNGLSAEFRAEHPEVAWRHVVNLRHLLAHHYHRVDPAQLWRIASVEMPTMLEQLSGPTADAPE